MEARMNRADVDEIFREVKANHAKLNACPGPHEFTIEYRKIGPMVRDWECAKCHGHVENLYKMWYERGLAHGRKRD